MCASFLYLMLLPPFESTVMTRLVTMRFCIFWTHFTGLVLILLGHSPTRNPDDLLGDPAGVFLFATFMLLRKDSKTSGDLLHALGASVGYFLPHQSHTSLFLGNASEGRAAYRIDLPKNFAELVIQRIRELHKQSLLRESIFSSEGIYSQDSLSLYSSKSELGEIFAFQLISRAELRISNGDLLQCFQSPVTWDQFVFPDGVEPPYPMFASDLSGGCGSNEEVLSFITLSQIVTIAYPDSRSVTRLAEGLQAEREIVANQPAGLGPAEEDAFFKKHVMPVISATYEDIKRFKSPNALYFPRADAEARQVMREHFFSAYFWMDLFGTVPLLIMGVGVYLFANRAFYGVVPVILIGICGLWGWSGLYVWAVRRHPSQLTVVTDQTLEITGLKPIWLKDISYIWIAKPPSQDVSTTRPSLLYIKWKGLWGSAVHATVFENYTEIRRVFEERGVTVKA